jgi:hypothetical protein
VLAERFRRGKLQKARDGHIISAKTPYGYRYETRHGLFRPGSSLTRQRLTWCANSMPGWSKTHAPCANASSASMPGRGSRGRGERNGHPR